jgi:hypothetical protein
MEDNARKFRSFWGMLKSLVSDDCFSPQDIVLKTGKEVEFDLTLLLTTRETNLSLPLVRGT